MELYQLRHIMTEPNQRITTRCYFLEAVPGTFVNMGMSLENDYSVPGVTVRLTEHHREDGCVAFDPEAFALLRQLRDWLPVADLPAPLAGVKDNLDPPPGSAGWLHLDAPDEFLARLPSWHSRKNSLVRAEVHTELTGLEVAIRKAILLWGLTLYGKVQEWTYNRAL